MPMDVFISAIIASTIFIIISQKYFLAKGFVDKIKIRSSHDSKATRSGGSAIFLTLLLFTSYYYFRSYEIFDFSLLIPLGLIFLIGLYDDVYRADFKLKFIFQIIVAKILIDQGVLIETLNGFIGIYEIPYSLSQILSIFIFLLIVNATNFTDGIDGLAVTEVLKSIILIIMFSDASFSLGYNYILYLTGISLLPIYIFNYRKEEKVFLGDSGSLLLGAILYVGILNLNNNIDLSIFLISTPLLIFICFLYPILDLVLVVIKRISNGNSPFKADKSHIHHMLISSGFSHLKGVIIISGISCVISILVYLIAHA